MKQETRKKILFRNAKYGAIKTLSQYILQFIVRTIFINTLGKEYLGLNGLFANIIGCLNIVELGIGTAIVFSMYKPIADNDAKKINSLTSLYKKIYYFLATIILFLGLAIIPVLKFFIKSDIPSDINIYIIYLITLINTIISYLCAHRRSLLYAYQRNDIESKVNILTSLSLNISQIAILLSVKNYYLYIICMPIFCLLDNFLIYTKTKKLYPEIKGKAAPLDNETKSEIKKNVLASSMSQIGGVFVTSTDNILISSMVGLAVLGAYTNYSTLILAVTAFITIITTSARGTIGNMIASESKELVYDRYKTFNFGMYWISGFCSICLLCLLNPFIYIWTGKSPDYLLDFSVVIVLVINFFISNTLSLTSTYAISAGLMWHNKWKTIIQGIVNILFSIIFCKLWGIIGIFLGTLASYISSPLWIDSKILFKKYFEKPLHNYWEKYIKFSLITSITCTLTYFICDLLPNTGVLYFLIKCIICVLLPNICYIICYYKTNEFKNCKAMVLNIFKSFKAKKSKGK